MFCARRAGFLGDLLESAHGGGLQLREKQVGAPGIFGRHQVVDVDNHPAEVLPVVLADRAFKLGVAKVRKLEEEILIPCTVQNR